MKITSYKVLICALVLVALTTGCGYSFNRPLLMPLIPVEHIEAPKLDGTIFIQEVGDLRKTKCLCKIEEEVFSVDADVGPMVRESISKFLEEHGVKFSRKAAYVYKINITRWDAELNDSFIPEIIASADLDLTVYDREARKLFSGKYLGRANIERMRQDNESLALVLGMAMREAISELIHDSNLRELIKK